MRTCVLRQYLRGEHLEKMAYRGLDHRSRMTEEALDHLFACAVPNRLRSLQSGFGPGHQLGSAELPLLRFLLVACHCMRDVVPAQLQTYLSPFLDIPFYFAAQHLPPRLTAALLATIEGTAFPLLYLINRHFTARRLVALGLAGLGMFTAGAISEVGNIMGNSLVAPLFLGAILRALHRSTPSERRRTRASVRRLSSWLHVGLPVSPQGSSLPSCQSLWDCCRIPLGLGVLHGAKKSDLGGRCSGSRNVALLWRWVYEARLPTTGTLSFPT